MDALELNEMLQGKAISRIEPGTTPGWVVIFFENNDPRLTDDEGKPVELFMTIFMGGSKFDHEESLYHSNCALHFRANNGCSTCDHVRDYGTPMPIAAADTITLEAPALCDAQMSVSGADTDIAQTVLQQSLPKAHLLLMTQRASLKKSLSHLSPSPSGQRPDAHLTVSLA
jgi:hypothetical protein